MMTWIFSLRGLDFSQSSPSSMVLNLILTSDELMRGMFAPDGFDNGWDQDKERKINVDADGCHIHGMFKLYSVLKAWEEE